MNGSIKQPCAVVTLCQTVGTGSVGQAAVGFRGQLWLPSPEGWPRQQVLLQDVRS